MTITMNLEVEVGICFEEIVSVLSKMGAEYEIEDGYLIGNFKNSNIYFVFRCFGAPDDVAAEGVDVSWKAGLSGAFYCPISSLLEGTADIKSFLTVLSAETNFRFALSFQYEVLYAIRDKFGVRFLKSMVG